MSNFLFCFLKPDARKHAINQWRHYLVCRKEGCGYLDESQPQVACTHAEALEYYKALSDWDKKGKKKKDEVKEQAEDRPKEEDTDGDGNPKEEERETLEGPAPQVDQDN